MIKAVIFDFGNVLLTWHPRELLLQYTPDTKRIEHFLPKVPQSATWYEIDRGTLSIEQAKAIFLERHPEDRDLIEYFFAHWLEMFAPIEGTVDLLAQVKQRGIHTYALSNFTKEAYEYATKKFDFFPLFDGQVISCQEGLIKPDPVIYARLLERFHLVASECVYVDDLQPFIDAGVKAGMVGILFTSPGDLRNELRNLGVL